jgi:hypothetical protein
MTTGTYPIPLYRSAVDGLVIPTDNNRQNLITRRPIPNLHYPMMTSPIRTSYVPQSYPIHSNVLRSSTGSILHRIPNPRTLTTTTMLRPTSVRWDSAINIVDFRTQPLVNQTKNFQNSTILSSGTKLIRSESFQIPNMDSINNRIIQKSKLDAKHFCGLPPIHENKYFLREIPPFQPPVINSR